MSVSYSWDDDLAWLAAHWGSNSTANQLNRLCLAAALYDIWRLRNAVVFQSRYN